MRNAFKKKGLDFQLFYSVKTNYSKAVLESVKEMAAGYEIVSSFEWDLVKNFKPKILVLNGPGKSKKLIKKILKGGSDLYLNIDNDTDIDTLKNLNESELEKIKIGIRVYFPGKDIWNRFGYNIFDKNFKERLKLINSFCDLGGIHFHLSTNNFDLTNYNLLFRKIKKIFRKKESDLKFLNIGGGLPAANNFIFRKKVYEKLPHLVKKLFPKAKIISEAGRNIVSDAINIEANIISLKKIDDNHFDVTIDANIMHFQCFFEKNFWVEYISKRKEPQKPTEINVFGNSCMQIDEIAKNVPINQIPSVGDQIIIHNIGAYSFSQAANFISKIPKIKIYE